MKRMQIVALTVVTGWLMGGNIARGEERSMPLRSFDRFEFDTENARGLWVEVATGLAREDDNGRSTDVVTVAPRLVYGGELAEGGLIIPYYHVDSEVNWGFGSASRGEDSIGDLQLYGKLVPLRSRWIDGGLGFELSVPTGDEDEGLGAGEVGLLPYGMVGAHLGPAELRAHFGYRAFPDSDDDYFASNSFPPNSFVYGGGLFGALGQHVAARVEIAGETLDESNSDTVVFFEPGLDFRLPLGPVDLLIRPTGAVGLTNDSPDWGVGGAVTLAWNPGAGA